MEHFACGVGTVSPNDCLVTLSFASAWLVGLWQSLVHWPVDGRDPLRRGAYGSRHHARFAGERRIRTDSAARVHLLEQCEFITGPKNDSVYGSPKRKR